jgi:[acyl-carrier-protein] S-malonyltransferase
MAKILAMFPGQGSQFVGMGRDLLSEFPATRVVFEEAGDATRVDVRKLCLDGPEDELKLTANTQPAILTVSVAMWKVLREETGIMPTAFAGHSLGEYSAVVASGRISFARAAFLVRRRGEAMQQAVAPGVGAMAAVMGSSAETLVEACKKATRTDHVVEVVNFNSPQQLVIAGHAAAVDELCKALEPQGARTVPLPVSAPFHSSLMRPAQEAMAPLIETTEFASGSAPIVANLTGNFESDYGARFLIEQIASPVRWTQCLESAAHADCDTYVEIGPNKVLFGLARRSLPKTVKLLHTEDLKATIRDLAGA